MCHRGQETHPSLRNPEAGIGVSLGELEEDAGGGFGMHKGDPVTCGATSRGFVYQAVAQLAAGCERGVEVRNPETDVVDARTAPGQKLCDGTFGVNRLQQLDIGSPERKRDNAGSVGFFTQMRNDAEHVPIEGQRVIDVLNRDTDVSDGSGHRQDLGLRT
jgi:hypothetical protein